MKAKKAKSRSDLAREKFLTINMLLKKNQQIFLTLKDGTEIEARIVRVNVTKNEVLSVIALRPDGDSDYARHVHVRVAYHAQGKGFTVSGRVWHYDESEHRTLDDALAAISVMHEVALTEAS